MNPIYRPIKETENAVSEMRGRGGYESNEITTKGGIKAPRVRQPIDVIPSTKPNAANEPFSN